MARATELLDSHLNSLASKQSYINRKRQYSQDMSNAIAMAFGEELRRRGMAEALPGGLEGVERRMSGGIGAKKVDVTWSTEECGLLYSISIKTINWRDGSSGNFQKNLTNRRGDMLFESTTLHRRFPYAVLYGFLFLDEEAGEDGTPRRSSTYVNAHHRLKMFTDRSDPSGRDEQYERLFIALVSADPAGSRFQFFHVGRPDQPIALEDIFDEAIELVADRNPDFFETVGDALRRI